MRKGKYFKHEENLKRKAFHRKTPSQHSRSVIFIDIYEISRPKHFYEAFLMLTLQTDWKVPKLITETLGKHPEANAFPKVSNLWPRRRARHFPKQSHKFITKLLPSGHEFLIFYQSLLTKIQNENFMSLLLLLTMLFRKLRLSRTEFNHNSAPSHFNLDSVEASSCARQFLIDLRRLGRWRRENNGNGCSDEKFRW